MSLHFHLNILGTRGIPAAHGGFETFAERLAIYLVSQGYGVTVYCQSERGQDLGGREDFWHGIKRVHFGTRSKGALATMEFDLKCVKHVVTQPGADLVLGYNTAIFNLIQKYHGRDVYMNMDGIEWQRDKWSWPARKWLKLNEWLGAKLCDVPIADHPKIADHIKSRTGRDCTMIPYGSDPISWADRKLLAGLGANIRPNGYFVSIARLEPENSIAELIEAQSKTDTQIPLLILGGTCPNNAFHRHIRSIAGDNVHFVGGIYDQSRLRAIRFFARAYLHGHQVGGTNPSLVEALGAGNAILAHDNRFNRWTAGQGQSFFSDVDECAALMNRLSVDDLMVHRARLAARAHHEANFQWPVVLEHYRNLMLAPNVLQVAAE